jgi:hypothetical protein
MRGMKAEKINAGKRGLWNSLYCRRKGVGKDPNLGVIHRFMNMNYFRRFSYAPDGKLPDSSCSRVGKIAHQTYLSFHEDKNILAMVENQGIL